MKIVDVNTVFGAYPSQRADSNADALIKLMTTYEIERVFSLSTWGIFYLDSAGNDQSLRAAQFFQGKVTPVATVSPHTFFTDSALAGLLQKPFAMYRFFPDLQNWPIDYAPFARISDTLRTSAKPLMVAVTRPGDATQLARLVADYPGPVVMEGVSGDNLAEALAVMGQHDRFLLETHRIVMPDGLLRLRDRVGIERLVFGSSAPGGSLAALLAYARGSGLSEAELTAFMGGNAERFLGGA